MRGLPSGDVTFAFVDVVGSTALLQQHGDEFVSALHSVQNEIGRCARDADGVVVNTAGDGAFLAFSRPENALAALVAIQHLRDADTRTPSLSLRTGAHRGHAVPVQGDYLALAVHIAARVAGAARGRQVLVSDAVANALGGGPDADWVDFGKRRLRDVVEPVRLYLVSGPADQPAAAPEERTNVARPHTSLLGREDLMRELVAAAGSPGLLTLVGPGGLGKTRLASEVALRLQDSLPGGAWLASLSRADDEGSVMEEVTAVVGVQVGGDDVPKRLAAALRDRGPTLLVLDNCEHVIDVVADIAEELRGAVPELRLLCTSRESLELTGERVIRPPTLLSREGGVSTAARLLVERAAAVGFAATPTDLSQIETICASLDGLPLAIELAAGRLAEMPLADLAAIVEEPHRSDVLRRRGGEPRQRTLEAVVRWSDDRLSAAERAALRVLSVFPSRFQREAAESVLTYVRDSGVPIAIDVVRLARCSLVDADGDRYRMLHTIRRMASQWLGEDPALERAAEIALVRWADKIARSLLDGPFDLLCAELSDQLPNLLAAVHAALEHDSELVANPLESVARYLPQQRGIDAEIVKLAARAATLAEAHLAAEGPTAPWVRARLAALVLGDGVGSGHLRVPDPAHHLDMVEAADRTGIAELRAWARIRAGQELVNGPHAELALEMTAAAIALSEGAPSVRSRALVAHGYVLHVSGDLPKAVDCYDASIVESLAAGNTPNAGTALGNKAEALLDLGDPAGALAAAQESLRYVDPRSPIAHLGQVMTGEAYADLGEHAEACRIFAAQRPTIVEFSRGDPSVLYALQRLDAALHRMGRSLD